MRLIMLLATIGGATALGADVVGSTGTTPPPCATTTVRYQAAKRATLGNAPWVLAQPAGAGVVAFRRTCGACATAG